MFTFSTIRISKESNNEQIIFPISDSTDVNFESSNNGAIAHGNRT